MSMRLRLTPAGPWLSCPSATRLGVVLLGLGSALAAAPPPASPAPVRSSASAEVWPPRHPDTHAASIAAAERAISQGRPQEAIAVLQRVRGAMRASGTATALELIPVMRTLARRALAAADRDSPWTAIDAAERTGDLACDLLPDLHALLESAEEPWRRQQYERRVAKIEGRCLRAGRDGELDRE